MCQFKKIFENKVVSFDTKESDTLALIDIEEKVLCNRTFLIGKIPKGATCNDWAEGLTASIAWDSVVNYMVFENLTDYMLRLELSEKDS